MESIKCQIGHADKVNLLYTFKITMAMGTIENMGANLPKHVVYF